MPQPRRSYAGRNPHDERELVLKITDKGRKLREKAEKVPAQMASCVCLSVDEATQLKALLEKVIL